MGIKKSENKVKEIEEEIQEEKRLWRDIKLAPEEERNFIEKLKDLTKQHKVKSKPCIPKKKKEKARKLFEGVELKEKKK